MIPRTAIAATALWTLIAAGEPPGLQQAACIQRNDGYLGPAVAVVCADAELNAADALLVRLLNGVYQATNTQAWETYQRELAARMLGRGACRTRDCLVEWYRENLARWLEVLRIEPGFDI
jgi:hypothetical protein